MNVSDISQVVAQIEFVPIYRCKCGNKAGGDSRSIRVYANNIYELFDRFEGERHTAAGMPVGWASGLNGIICSNCSDKEEEEHARSKKSFDDLHINTN